MVIGLAEISVSSLEKIKASVNASLNNVKQDLKGSVEKAEK